MARTKKGDLTDAQLIELLAQRLNLKLEPANGRTFDIVLPDKSLCVSVDLRVSHQSSKAEQADFREAALAIIADPDSTWRDRCDCSTTKKERYSKNYGSCSNLPVGVVVYKSPTGRWDGRRYDPDKPEYNYSFRCHAHIDKRGDRSEQHVVFRTVFVHGIKDAHDKRHAALKERERLSKMTEIERIAEDARMEMRPSSATVAAEIEKQNKPAFQVGDVVAFKGVSLRGQLVEVIPALLLDQVPLVVRQLRPHGVLLVQPQGGLGVYVHANEVQPYPPEQLKARSDAAAGSPIYLTEDGAREVDNIVARLCGVETKGTK